MDDVTHLFSTYRECARHLWNTYFQPVVEPTQNWDIRDEFDTAARSIFSSLVLRPLGVFDHELAPEWSPSPLPLHGFCIVPLVEDGTPISINRDMPRSGYWDHPIALIRPSEVELHLLRFFDFDQLGCREFCYYEVVIHASATYPDLVGRDALIEVRNARVLFTKPAA
ncbi:MAG: hypothetical protein ACKVY0_18730 [Prosthecobacter sp.]|uniref:hypothetical protein n=1 Tax=Prosthecobacter sp. TaxID=1965333 RepID=UPI0038FF06FA